MGAEETVGEEDEAVVMRGAEGRRQRRSEEDEGVAEAKRNLGRMRGY